MARDAAAGYVESLRKHQEPIPTDDETLVTTSDLEGETVPGRCEKITKPCHSERSEESAFVCFQGNKCRCFASLSMTANFFTPSGNRFSSPMVAFLQARKLERLPSFLASSLFLTAGGAFKEGKWAEPGERAACRLRRRCRPHCCQPPSEPRRWCSGQRKRVCPGRRSDSRSWRRTPPARSNRG